MTTRALLNPRNASDIAIKAVIFDMDGTLCLPQTYMFKQMRDALGIDKSVDILDHIHSLPPDEEEIAQEKLRVIERAAMLDMVPQPGLAQLMDFLTEHNLPKSICTRNFPIPVNHLLNAFLSKYEFGPLIITREFKPPKPHPHGILHIAKSWGIHPENIVMVGDSIDDMQAGYRAGCATVLLNTDVNHHVRSAHETDVWVESLSEIIELLKTGVELKPKKVTDI